MRTNLVIDDSLMKAAIKAGGYKTKKATVEAGLQLVIQLKGQEKMRALRGKLHWEGNLDEMRRG